MATKLKIVGLRHGKADAANDTGDKHGDDLARVLNDIGIGQAQTRSNSFSGLAVDHIFASPAERAQRTAEIALGKVRDDFIVVPELYTPQSEDGEVLDSLFGTIGYEPPSAYFKADTSGAVGRFQDAAGQAIAAKLGELNGTDVTAVIAGHAVYTPLALLGVAEELGALDQADESLVQQLNDLNMAEAGAVVMTITDGVLTGVEVLN